MGSQTSHPETIAEWYFCIRTSREVLVRFSRTTVLKLNLSRQVTSVVAFYHSSLCWEDYEPIFFEVNKTVNVDPSSCRMICVFHVTQQEMDRVHFPSSNGEKTSEVLELVWIYLFSYSNCRKGEIKPCGQCSALEEECSETLFQIRLWAKIHFTFTGIMGYACTILVP